MSGKRSRTVSISLDERGQTTQDFAVGIGIFLLAIAFVFSYVPTLLTPFSAGTGTAETAQADRIAATILEEYSEEANDLNVEDLDDINEDDLIEEFGLRSADDGDVRVDRLSVTLESLDGEDTAHLFGDDHEDADSTASAGRVVTIDGNFDNMDDIELDAEDCDPACRLVVRVW